MKGSAPQLFQTWNRDLIRVTQSDLIKAKQEGEILVWEGFLFLRLTMPGYATRGQDPGLVGGVGRMYSPQGADWLIDGLIR